MKTEYLAYENSTCVVVNRGEPTRLSLASGMKSTSGGRTLSAPAPSENTTVLWQIKSFAYKERRDGDGCERVGDTSAEHITKGYSS